MDLDRCGYVNLFPFFVFPSPALAVPLFGPRKWINSFGLDPWAGALGFPEAIGVRVDPFEG
ncbi:hypothetical protein P170DRAFT_431488 [Aspergillus steynii IBT 23096]|uniref:Uncharacterized protein n=1 Tax=Aspergillus steynii IBT 23096 TaxID=1392250 RepID=A0A2I2GLC8_9EURO|nr:uncharacterized protein P170DRAFT_431488 [Aspergillus steynii IBT 23096]PLB53659.1 hypothetical protein P170DRAFT_431488 [Aspergillus steynii IBT 23096]